MRALLLALLCAAAQAQDARRSGFDFMSPATQAMQRDDTLNPAALALAAGEQRFDADCRRCHEPAAMRGVAARYPAWDDAAGRPVTLGERINACRVRHIKAPAWAAESEDLLSLQAHVGRQSRGLPIAPPADARLAPAREAGRRLSSSAWASWTCRARSATTAPPAANWAAARSRRATPRGTRSTAWNGRRWARCSGGCATA